MHSDWITALLFTTAAGLSTSIGALVGIAVKKPSPRFMGFTLGFSAGVMVSVSFLELLQAGIQSVGFLNANIAFFTGMFIFFTIDFFVPHEYIGQQDHCDRTSSLMRTGLLIALGIGIHNLPEGMATFVGTLENVNVGMAIGVAIAIHNIPEGLAVAAPIYAATGSRAKAFFWSFLSGVSEPVGAGLAALILMPFLSRQVLGVFLAGVAGIMVSISIDELVPAAKSYGYEHIPILGFIFGMMVMALSLHILQ